MLFVEGKQIDHPVLITECACNPVQSRSKMAELLFESYGVPSVGRPFVVGPTDIRMLMHLVLYFCLNCCNYNCIVAFVMPN